MNKTVVLGVCGSIAAYKSCQITRDLIKHNINVVVILTENAKRFVLPLTLQVLSRNKVIDSLFPSITDFEKDHISLADKADLLLIAPATYNFINKVACGIADDFLSTFTASFQKDKIIAPAMDEGMYKNPILQENIKKLKDLGYLFIEPEVGELATGKIGKGRLADIPAIINTVLEKLKEENGLLSGKKILITIGPTREYIDKLRFISNTSSGKMGYYLAKACAEFGAQVRVIIGNYNFDWDSPNISRKVMVSTAEDMLEAVKANLSWCDICIFCAAVLDYKPRDYLPTKLKEKEINITLVKNIDLIKEANKYKDNKIFIGFCCDEDEILIEEAERKLKEKELDFIIANSIRYVSQDMNEVIIIDKDYKRIKLPCMHKKLLAKEIIKKLFT
jgi:phosphopantothenoylcysteine decarboxylase/phosphopantothenate--cysteine ligase